MNSATSFVQKRCENMVADPVLTAAAVLTNHHDWPAGDKNLLFLHGENEVQTLYNHFRVLLQRHDFILQEHLDEWMNLKIHVQQVRGELEWKQNLFWKQKFMFCQQDYPNLLILIEFCLVIPCQSACCERGNSCLNRIMTDWRSSLDVATVKALMIISIDGPSPEDYHARLAVG